jgi:hypothetical protein
MDQYGSGQEEEDEGASAATSKGATNVVVTLSKVPWDPTTSTAWDKEKHSRDAIVRVKG